MNIHIELANSYGKTKGARSQRQRQREMSTLCGVSWIQSRAEFLEVDHLFTTQDRTARRRKPDVM